MVSAKCAKRKYSYLLPTPPVLRLEGSRTLLEFLHRIHFQPPCRFSASPQNPFHLLYMSHFHGRWAGSLPGRQDSRATDNQTIHSIPYRKVFVPTTRTNFFRYSSRHYMYCRAGQLHSQTRTISVVRWYKRKSGPNGIVSHTGQNSLSGLHAELRRCQGPRNA